MSNWTHVSGTIRIDAIRGRLENDVNFDTLIGKECLWESEMEVWEDVEKNPKAYLPMGSEGSLQKLVWINPDEESVDVCVVTIFGDLRDHDSAESIIEWFEAKNDMKYFKDRMEFQPIRALVVLPWDTESVDDAKTKQALRTAFL